MPARKKPVKKRVVSKLAAFVETNTPRFVAAPANAQNKKILDGEIRSVRVKIAKSKVPIINPNCTAAVICPTMLSGKLSAT